jgi:hypothetical protein
MKTILVFLMLMSLGCAVQGKREEVRDRPVIDGKARDYVELSTPEDPTPRMPPVGFVEEETETTSKSGKKSKVFEYKIRLQLRCQGGLVEAPLRGKILSWNWEGITKSRTVSDTDGFVSILYKSPRAITVRSFKWTFGSSTGTVDLNKGPYLLVFEGASCK